MSDVVRRLQSQRPRLAVDLPPEPGLEQSPFVNPPLQEAEEPLPHVESRRRPYGALFVAPPAPVYRQVPAPAPVLKPGNAEIADANPDGSVNWDSVRPSDDAQPAPTPVAEIADAKPDGSVNWDSVRPWNAPAPAQQTRTPVADPVRRGMNAGQVMLAGMIARLGQAPTQQPTDTSRSPGQRAPYRGQTPPTATRPARTAPPARAPGLVAPQQDPGPEEGSMVRQGGYAPLYPVRSQTQVVLDNRDAADEQARAELAESAEFSREADDRADKMAQARGFSGRFDADLARTSLADQRERWIRDTMARRPGYFKNMNGASAYDLLGKAFDDAHAGVAQNDIEGRRAAMQNLRATIGEPARVADRQHRLLGAQERARLYHMARDSGVGIGRARMAATIEQARTPEELISAMGQAQAMDPTGPWAEMMARLNSDQADVQAAALQAEEKPRTPGEMLARDLEAITAGQFSPVAIANYQRLAGISPTGQPMDVGETRRATVAAFLPHAIQAATAESPTPESKAALAEWTRMQTAETGTGHKGYLLWSRALGLDSENPRTKELWKYSTGASASRGWEMPDASKPFADLMIQLIPGGPLASALMQGRAAAEAPQQ